jgi:hypothetical protein
MIGLNLRLIEGEQLLQTLPNRYFDFQGLVDKYREVNRENNKKLLEQIAVLISKKFPLNQWPPELCNRFLLMACAVARDAIEEIESLKSVDTEVIQAIIERADWLCNFTVAVSNQVDVKTKSQVCGLWIMSRLAAGVSFANEMEFVESAVSALTPVGVPKDELVNQVKAQVVMHVSKQVAYGQPVSFSVEIVRQWCQELLPQYKFLSKAASTLGILLKKPVVELSSETPQIKSQEDINKPRIWRIPELIPQSRLKPELQSLLSKINERKTLLSLRTATQLGDLTPDSEISVYSRVLYFAARDLWKAYWSQGDRDSLELASRISLFLYSVLTLQGGEERDRSHVLHLWMNTQLPTLIHTCNLWDLLEDATRLYSSLKCLPGDLTLREGIIEAYAGECRWLETQGDLEGCEALLRDNSEVLRQIHNEYCQKAGEISERPSEDEDAAWKYLLPMLTRHELITSSPSPSIIHRASDLSDVIKRGSQRETYDFVRDHLEEIKEMLSQRLGVRLSPEHLMFPEGVVYNPKAVQRGTPHPLFVEAVELLRRGEYKQASALFERLADQMGGRSREICRNFQAYALAKQGDLLLARGYLRNLSRAGFPYPSAHWNLACCIPCEQHGDMEDQLNALATGLDCAPHPRILHGAVYLALLLQDDRRLRQWLPCLTLIEALLLWYYLEFESMNNEARDHALLRIALCIRQGEPKVPDPTAPRLSRTEINSFLNSLLERHQEKAFEFWLRCRESVAHSRFDYWELKADFLERIGRRAEAAQAFKEELRCRFSLLRSGRTVRFYFLPTTRRRVKFWLQQCMTPELRDVGYDIYNMVTQFEEQHNITLLPRDRTILTYYGKIEKGPSSPLHPLSDLERLIVSAGAECDTRFHEVSHLPFVRDQLEKLKEALQQHGHRASAEALEHLLREWEGYSQHQGKDERQAALQRAQTAFAQLKGCMQRELTSQQRVVAKQLLNAFERVNDRLARSLNLLPELVIEALDGSSEVNIDPSVEKTAFAVRVRSSPNSAPIRLKNAVALLDDGKTELPLRDKLEEIEVMVSPERSAVLTFEVVSNLLADQPRTARVVVNFEYPVHDDHNALFESNLYNIKLVPRSCPPLPARSPYIHGRALEPNEIEGHFFGREREQEKILESVRNGQQRILYIEGIRRSGKSSLLKSIVYEVNKRNLPLIPVYLSAASLPSLDHAGRILYNFLDTIARHPEVTAAGVVAPKEEQCCSNAPSAYRQFVEELADKIPNRRVLALLDDFQVLIETGKAARENDPPLAQGIIGLLNLILEYANPNARLLWVFAGHRPLRQYREAFPGVLLWGQMRTLPIDFLDKRAVGEILTAPLADTNVVVPLETIDRVYYHTSGHPEVVQQLAELMLEKATAEKRPVLTPSDADEAAYELTNYSDTFADTWYPIGELSEEQRSFMAAFINAVKVGHRIEPHRLAPGNQLTDALKMAINDLVARKILDIADDGTIGVKAYVLDLWLRRTLPTMITDRVNGSIAIFIDVANLTKGTGESEVDIAAGEGGSSRKFKLATVIDRIENYARSLSAAPIAARWVVNYPRKSPAVIECNAKGYYVENIPEELFNKKGSDDVVLIEKMRDVEQQYPLVNCFILVTGDKDYSIAVKGLLERGKFVHIVSRSTALAQCYDELTHKYPNRFTVKYLEELFAVS